MEEYEEQVVDGEYEVAKGELRIMEEEEEEEDEEVGVRKVVRKG